jgi:hypothetical protein
MRCHPVGAGIVLPLVSSRNSVAQTGAIIAVVLTLPTGTLALRDAWCGPFVLLQISRFYQTVCQRFLVGSQTQ